MDPPFLYMYLMSQNELQILLSTDWTTVRDEHIGAPYVYKGRQNFSYSDPGFFFNPDSDPYRERSDQDPYF